MKIRSGKTIASFDTNANDLSMQFISEVNWLRIDQTYESQINSKSNNDQSHFIKQSTIRLNDPIIIMLIGKRPGAAEVGGLKIDVER